MTASFEWNSRKQKITEIMSETLSDLHEAQSEERGYLLTKDASFAENFDGLVTAIASREKLLEQLVRDNPLQYERSVALQAAVSQRILTIKKLITLAREGRFDEARTEVLTGRDRVDMGLLVQKINEIQETEHELLLERIATLKDHAAWNKQLVIGGTLVIILLVSGLLLLVTRGIRNPIRMIQQAMSDFGNGDLKVRVNGRMGCTEFDMLAHGYNTMADRLEDAVEAQEASDRKLVAANAELTHNSNVLKIRGQSLELLGEMAHRLQAARTEQELSAIVCAFVPRVIPGIDGALYAHNNSRNLLLRIAHWGNVSDELESLTPDSCWALRLGQSHSVSPQGNDIMCAHVKHDVTAYHCEPLLASGEVVGLFYLQGTVAEENRFLLSALIENIASALVNQKLQKDLREQTIRDPLTGLYNRRYMEEMLSFEIARSRRENTAFGVIIGDIDHFKKVNDDFGHDAGDVVLCSVAAEIQNSFRSNDIVCRLGGEEFLIISAVDSLDTLVMHTERLRTALAALELHHDGKKLRKITMSFGIALWRKTTFTNGAAIIKAADEALYRAKSEGRDRIVVAT
ncbi:diguanylate cyclase [Komagataeibacter sp. FNDCR2]|uniref:diguanylate cyclase n=1 Tax=Komagataeibacter sp. FNDCR2 TaxID=2878682 RepID=UPI001E545220|nr:diguanylate cyclase [Komagataeibacter sp. FNDCR2]MCE2576570.1 diguanylate cyclase [Komagataeibacter sp. FNDCR2]